MSDAEISCKLFFTPRFLATEHTVFLRQSTLSGQMPMVLGCCQGRRLVITSGSRSDFHA